MLRSVKHLKFSFSKGQLLRKLGCTTLNRDSTEIHLSDEVKYALQNSLPIVALESTIVTHGMPYPRNIECALEVEAEIRKKGAIPATIGIIKGDIKAGLSEAEISELGDTNTNFAIKTSRRDLAYVVANKLNGGTTVSGTLIIAQKTGIPIFATGGLGGVHRAGEKTFDISTDLTELGKTSVAVFSSGVKSILDIPKTLEYLETQGVFVATFGDTKDFPGFYCAKSGYHVPYNVTGAQQAAALIKTNYKLAMNSAMLFGVPVPIEYSLNKDELDQIIGEALHLAKKQGVIGKEITPFLLKYVAEATKGKSLSTNIALVKNNASVAADVAVELSRLGGCRRPGSDSTTGTEPNTARPKDSKEDEDRGPNLGKRPVVIGGCVLDRCITLHEKDVKLDGRIHLGRFTESPGGVARNIVDALIKLNCPPIFLSAIGDDSSARIVTSQFPNETTEHIEMISNATSAQCTIVFDAIGECKVLFGDMEIHKKITPEFIRRNEDIIKNAPVLVLDANPTVEAIGTALEIAGRHNVPVFFEPTDVVISEKPFLTPNWRAVKFISPNMGELKHIAKIFKISIPNNENKIDQASFIAKSLSKYIDTIIVTLGADGVLVARHADSATSLLTDKITNLQIRHYPVDLVNKLVNVSGAGDCMVSGIIWSMLKGFNEKECISIGIQAASCSLQSFSAVPKKFSINSNDKLLSVKCTAIL